MERLIFCNIGWMSWYRGLANQADKIVGGGSYVEQNNSGHEVCNFLPCGDGKVYGHVESVRRNIDRRILIENMGGGKKDSSLSGITLIWTATHPTEGGRRIVGWYQNATIFRQRQSFSKPPSTQHRKDEIESFRIVALAVDSHLFDANSRDLRMPSGKGWMGHTPWWSPAGNATESVQKYIAMVRELISGGRFNDASASEIDIDEIEKKDIPKTTKTALIEARRGQGGFRKDLMSRWTQKCAVTGCGIPEVLRASHIKAWRSCSDTERLDSNNGLLLAAHLDALFDRGLISFSDEGSMLIANRVSQKERRKLGLSIPLRENLLDSERSYLAHHRKEYGFEA